MYIETGAQHKGIHGVVWIAHIKAQRDIGVPWWTLQVGELLA